MDDKNKKKKTTESDADFLKRMQELVTQSTKQAESAPVISTPAVEKMREQGEKTAVHLAELEECDKIVEEFKKNPPVVTSKHIAGILVEWTYTDPETERKVNMLKKHTMPFHNAVKDTSIDPIRFETFGNAYLIRGGKKVLLPPSSQDLPFIIKDGDVIGTEDKSFVLEIKHEIQDEDKNYWHIFIFPNSELKISVSESTSSRGLAFMSTKEVTDATKAKSSNTVIKYEIKGVELIKGLFNLRIKKAGQNINNLVKFAGGYPAVEFMGENSLMNAVAGDLAANVLTGIDKEILKKMPDLVRQYEGIKSKSKDKSTGDAISSMIELNNDKSVVLFNTGCSIKNKASGQISKMVPSDPFNPIKITIRGSNMIETDCSKNPDPRVRAVMKMWMAISSYVGMLSTKNDLEAKQSGRSLSVEKAQKVAALAKTLGDTDMEKAAASMLRQAENEVARQKSYKQSFSSGSQKEEAENMLKFAEESGDKDLIFAAKAQISAASGGMLGAASATPGPDVVLSQVQNFFEKFRRDVEVTLPPYSSSI